MQIDYSGVTVHNADRATPGHVLFSPVQGSTVHLIDYTGQELHRWDIHGKCTNWCYLLPNGNLFANEAGSTPGPVPFGAGLMREYAPDGSVVWEHEDTAQHHDARRLAGGGTVYAAWERLDDDKARALGGGIPGTEADGAIYSEVIREIDAAGATTWEWRLADHVDAPFFRNAVRRNYGHCNTVCPLPNGDYLLSLKVLNMLLIVRRATGEITWQFQNDALGGQHDVQMTEAGTVLVFANGTYSPDLAHSQVWEIDPKTDEIIWRFTEPKNPMNFFSTHISGVQRLASGNTLICEGAKGAIFEVTPGRDVVWHYVNPHWQPHPKFTSINWVFRARHYAPGSPELAPYV
ncbi:MAG: arylsulfotransferase family protein [Pseudomonadota bacterium]